MLVQKTCGLHEKHSLSTSLQKLQFFLYRAAHLMETQKYICINKIYTNWSRTRNGDEFVRFESFVVIFFQSIETFVVVYSPHSSYIQAMWEVLRVNSYCSLRFSKTFRLLTIYNSSIIHRFWAIYCLVTVFSNPSTSGRVMSSKTKQLTTKLYQNGASIKIIV